MSILPLIPHPTGLRGPVEDLSVEVERTGPSAILVRYLLAGDLDRISIARPGQGARADGLWRKTCFEAFVRRNLEPGYLELNYAPSGDWAAYKFDSYRTGMAELDCRMPNIKTSRNDRRFALIAEIKFGEGIPFPLSGSIEMALTAVIELTTGEKSYWALSHPTNQPDFHHPAGFVYELSGK